MSLKDDVKMIKGEVDAIRAENRTTHDFIIRMEPVVDAVADLKKWKDGNGGFNFGAQFQLRAIWVAFTGGTSALWYKITHGG